MPARRCSICALDWPPRKTYRLCPSCLEETSPVSNITAMPSDEAKSLRLHFEFERYYEEYDAKADPARLVPSD